MEPGPYLRLPSHRQSRLMGRECPSCEQYFKLKPRIGLPVEDCRPT
jgi:hypothetical protein